MNTKVMNHLTTNIYFYWNDSMPFECIQYIPKPKFENRITNLK